MNIDDALLRQAEQHARQHGKSLGTLLEDALRMVIQPSVSKLAADAPEVADGLEADDPFFTALDEIRGLGRIPARHRSVDLG